VSIKLSKDFKFMVRVIVSIFGLFVFFIIVGFVVDCCTYPAMKRIGNKALESLISQSKKKSGNAWDYYLSAIEMSENIESNKMLEMYLDDRIEVTPEIKGVIKASEAAIKKMKQGSKMTYCSIPYDYEKGLKLKIPDFLTLRNLVKILCVESLHKIRNGETEEGISDLLCVMNLGKHIECAAPLLLDQMIGSFYISEALKVLKIGLSTGLFNDDELKQIHSSLAQVEEDLPFLSTALEGEEKKIKVSFAHFSIWKTSRVILLMSSEGAEKPLVFEKLGLRLSCWRYFFSPRLAAVKSFGFMDKVVQRMKEIENKSNSNSRNANLAIKPEELLQEKMNRYTRINPVFRIIDVNVMHLFHRKLRCITRIKVLQLACNLCSYNLENGHFPKYLEDIGDDIILDFNTGKKWEYSNWIDSITVFSPGPNSLTTKDDISVTLFLRAK